MAEPNEDEVDETADKTVAEENKDTDPEVPEEPANDSAKSDPPSAMLFRDAHADMHKMCKAYGDALSTIEHPGAIKHMTKLLGSWQKHIEELRDEFSKHYPSLKALGEGDDDSEADVDDSGEDAVDELEESAGEEVPVDEETEEEPAPPKRAAVLSREEKQELARLQRAMARMKEQLVG